MDFVDRLSLGAAIFMAALIFSAIPAWATHVIWLISKLAGDAGVTAGQVILGILGTLLPPFGVIHGYMIWFGYGLS